MESWAQQGRKGWRDHTLPLSLACSCLEAPGQQLCIARDWAGQGLSPWHQQGSAVGSDNPETCPRADTDTLRKTWVVHKDLCRLLSLAEHAATLSTPNLFSPGFLAPSHLQILRFTCLIALPGVKIYKGCMLWGQQQK